MTGRLDLRRWIQVYHEAYAVAQSDDGRYVAVGTEKGAAIFSLSGHRLAEYPVGGGEMPVHRMCASLDLAYLVLSTRLGEVIYLDLEAVDGRFQIEKEKKLYSNECDIHTLAFSLTSEWIAIGHLSFALTVFDLEGEILWQQQDRGAAALGTTWSVASHPSSDLLYAGCAGGSTTWLVALDGSSGKVRSQRECEGPVTAVAVLPDRSGVVTLSTGEYYAANLTAYDPDLGEILWKQEMDGPATALAADVSEPLLAVGAGHEGYIRLFNASTGALLASEPVRALINGLSIVQGKFLAAVTQDGNVALLRYLP